MTTGPDHRFSNLRETRAAAPELADEVGRINWLRRRLIVGHEISPD
jgi:hypothetical protein